MKTTRWSKTAAAVSSLALLMMASPAWAPPEKCGTPMLSAPAFAAGSVNILTWEAPSPATDKGYKLEVASTIDVDGEGNFLNVEQTFPNLPATPNSLEVSGLSETVHYYHVRAMGGGGCRVSEWSDVIVTLQDATVPSVSVAADRAPDFGDWYTAPVSIEWSGADSAGGSGLASCDSLLYSGPDVASNTVSGKCVDNAGNEASASFTLNYDATAPTAIAVASRAPDFGDWYTAPFSVDWVASEDVSGIVSCSAAGYSGPDTDSDLLEGTCTDGAGHTSAISPFSFKYDATAPAIEFSTADGHIFLNEPITISGTLTDLSPSSVTVSLTNTTAGIGSLVGAPAPITVLNESGFGGDWPWSVTFADAAPGTYLVTATGLDSSGHSVTDEIEITILSGPLV